MKTDILFHLYQLSDFGLVLALVFVAVILGIFAAVRHYLARVAEREYLAGHDTGYLRGRRDERAELSKPSGTHDCYYPMIIETLGDGTQRRLDR